jgi:hypothetical protein
MTSAASDLWAEAAAAFDRAAARAAPDPSARALLDCFRFTAASALRRAMLAGGATPPGRLRIAASAVKLLAYRLKMAIRRSIARRRIEPLGSAELVAAIRTASHAASLTPVLRAWIAAGGSALPAATGDVLADRMAASGTPAIRIDRVGAPLVSAWKHRVAAARIAWHEAAVQLPPDERRGFPDARWRACVQAVDRAWRDATADASRTAAAWETLARASTAPRFVVIDNPVSFDGAIAAHVVSACGIPVVDVQHGSVRHAAAFWSHAPLTLLCCWGEASREGFIANGVSPDVVRVTGTTASRVQRTGSRKGVLVATSGSGGNVSHDQHAAFVDLLYRAAAMVADIAWTAKLHVKDRVALYEAASARHRGGNVRVIAADRATFGADIGSLLAESSLLVTVTSTSALDALRAGVPYALVDVGIPKPIGLSYIDDAPAFHASTPEQLASLARKAASGTLDAAIVAAQREYAHREFAAFDAAPRIVELIRSLVSARTP